MWWAFDIWWFDKKLHDFFVWFTALITGWGETLISIAFLAKPLAYVEKFLL